MITPYLAPTVAPIESLGNFIGLETLEGEFGMFFEEGFFGMLEQRRAQSLAMFVVVNHHEVDECAFCYTVSDNLITFEDDPAR